jgi:hypothetical protein
VRRVIVLVGLMACGASPPRDTPAAETLVHRRFVTGTNTESSLATYTLRIAGERAELVVRTRSAERTFPPTANVERWETDETETRVGVAKRTKLGVALRFGNLELECTREQAYVARAAAVRAAPPSTAACPRQSGAWSPADTITADVLDCTPADAEEILDHMVWRFARSPGIEWLELEDVCGLVGAGWRQIPADGSVAAVR